MLSDRFADALSYAAALHQRQVRKGTEIPYVSHLMAVAALALEHGANETTAIAALLHDAIEDQGQPETAPQIALRFGPDVLELVRACSEIEAEADMPQPPWRERKAAFIAAVDTAPAEACLIMACDKTHNLICLLRDLDRDGLPTLDRFREPTELAWYFESMADALDQRGALGPVEQLLALSSEFSSRVRGGT